MPAQLSAPGHAGAPRPARKPIIFNVLFPLKPYLHDFITSIAGGEAFALTNENRMHVVSDYTRLGLGRHIKHPGHLANWVRAMKRRSYTVLISERVADRYGVEPRHYIRFESLVEQLFYHMLLAHVEARAPQPRHLRACVRAFMDRHEIGAEHCDYETLTRIVQRMRHRGRRLTPSPVQEGR